MKWSATERSMTFGRELVDANSDGYLNLLYIVDVSGNTQTKYGINQMIKDINRGIKMLETEKAQLREMKKSFER